MLAKNCWKSKVELFLQCAASHENKSLSVFNLWILMQRFSALQSQSHGFVSSEKLSWDLDVVALWSSSLDIVVLRSWKLNAVVYALCNLCRLFHEIFGDIQIFINTINLMFLNKVKYHNLTARSCAHFLFFELKKKSCSSSAFFI